MELNRNSTISKLFKNSKTTKRVVLMVFFAIIFLACYSVVSSYFMYCEQTLSRLDAIAKTLSAQIDGDKHFVLTNTHKKPREIANTNEDSLYKEIHSQLVSVANKNHLSAEISTLIYNDSLKKFFYVVNSSDSVYYLDEYSQNQASFLKYYQTGGKLPKYSDEYDTWLSAISPIKNSSGKVVAIVEVDERYDDFMDIIDDALYRKIVVALLMFAVVAFILIRYLRQILLGEEAAKKELQHSYEIINQHNEDMLNSINYAKKIQVAILPPIEVITKNLPKSFIFYRPKDIVSGDFYFFKEIIPNQKFIIAACDCTGHGVPGALMSMIGNNFLEHIVNDEFNSPAKILTTLNRAVINTLKQDGVESESRDGMDVSLCLIDKTEDTLIYAGANRPLYMVDDTGNCTEIKGDKRPIGGLDNSLFEFNEHKINLKAQVSYYLFTDGYADQFGGDKNKKFSTRQFKTLLSSLSQLSMNLQLDKIQEQHNVWKRNNEQTDDVLVIGFQID